MGMPTFENNGKKNGKAIPLVAASGS